MMSPLAAFRIVEDWDKDWTPRKARERERRRVKSYRDFSIPEAVKVSPICDGPIKEPKKQEGDKAEDAEAPKRKIFGEEILFWTCKIWGFKKREFKGKYRTRPLGIARQAAYYLCIVHTNLSYYQVGKIIGNRDHSTVFHGVKKTQERLDAGDIELSRMLRLVEARLRIPLENRSV